MCNATPKSQQQADERPEMEATDRDIRRAEIQLRAAELQSAVEFNRSPAGIMQRQFEAYQRIAKPLSESNFVPAAYKGNIGDCIIAVEIASRLNVFPLTVMQNLCIVKGNPTWKTKFLIGCVNSCGRYTTLEYRISIDGKVGQISYKTWKKNKEGKNTEVLQPFENPELDNLVCVAVATEKATGKELVSPPVSLRMAVGEGWYSKDGSKWPTMTELMIRYRAASYWVSTFAPETALGFRTVEEQQDIVDVEYEEVSSATPKTTAAAVENAKEKLRSRDTMVKAGDSPEAKHPSIDMP
ncbi:MAG: hypothetical protein HDS77_06990 [Bacteroidales bacterium]|nr:hypothetical protein [Bacteroidales bacterium]